MGNKYFDGKITNKNVVEDVDKEFINNINTLYDKVANKIDVSLGMYDANNIEVIEGLSEGDKILISSYKELENKNSIQLKESGSEKEK